MLTEGMYIADRYEIIGKIGAGGMSNVRSFALYTSDIPPAPILPIIS